MYKTAGWIAEKEIFPLWNALLRCERAGRTSWRRYTVERNLMFATAFSSPIAVQSFSSLYALKV
jgi:hypothetical protein